ncbi:hypothetical protein L6452_44487 [Arctium lappa]|uniref:Uncharacterized protein n=1 Tax=Arctium lappa TaxID=4217 RepID=A0ACB8XFW4_ARCLA|nr:hypothetical protein L6452_44487 [Arctium lappa]
MGCINSKNVASSCNSPILRDSPDLIHGDSSLSSNSISTISSDSLTLRKLKNYHHHHNHNRNHSFEPLEKIKEETEDDKTSEGSGGGRDDNNNKKKVESLNNSRQNSKRFGFSIRFGRSIEGEQVAAGWPAWLSSVAKEAIDGWLPLKSDSFERLEKIGQGTYSNVYRARELQTGRMMALKKVRFDNFQPESVRFMAREIKILRRLDHPNVMKLEGIITSRLSCSIYLVFEYMEHDLCGLLSNPEVKFTDSQIKCYMLQLLKGVEHCHSRGVIHRDIKSSNILVNNEGVLKIADFGLANFFSSKSRQPLTSRVVTLWYRPPELLLGSTSYGPYVDMWSVGCVFAELFVGRPVLKGRTEVEQLHKIFKLCGTPPDEYWTKSKLPLAAMFRPQFTYISTLRERCKELPRTVVDLIEALITVEPEKRATAKSALQAEYFYTRPYACDPASMPKYPPNKEIDAKFREQAGRRKAGGRVRASGASRNPRRPRRTLQEHGSFGKLIPGEGNRNFTRDSVDSKASYDTVSEVSQTTEASQADTVCTLPAQATASNGSFSWATNGRTYEEFTSRPSDARRTHLRNVVQMNQSFIKFESFDASGVYEPQDISSEHQEQETFRPSGPKLFHSLSADGRQQENHRRYGDRRSRFSRVLRLQDFLIL